jgi:hypothetical protein
LDFNLSLFALWLIKLAIHETINVEEASAYLIEKIKNYEKTAEKNNQMWFVFVTVNQAKSVQIFGFNQVVIVGAENEFSIFDMCEETSGINGKQSVFSLETCNLICFFSKNLVDIYKKNKTIDYLKTNFIKSSQNNLNQTLKSISEQTGVNNSFAVRLLQ